MFSLGGLCHSTFQLTPARRLQLLGENHGNEHRGQPCTHASLHPHPKKLQDSVPQSKGAGALSPGPGPSEGSAETWGAGGSRSPPSPALAELGRGFQPGQRPRCLWQGRVPSCSQRRQRFLFKAIVLATFPVQKPEAGANATCAIYFGFFFFLLKALQPVKGMRVSLPQTAHQNSLFCNIYSRQFLHVRQGRSNVCWDHSLFFSSLACPGIQGCSRVSGDGQSCRHPPHTRVGRNPELLCPGPPRRC